MDDQLYRDAPTGLYNRRYLEELLPETIAELIYQDQPFTLVIVDIDHFKMVNDLYGHDRGDAVIKSFAQFLQEATRSSDKVIRYGGDEFICFLPNLGRQNAEALYGRIIRQCHEKDFNGLSVSISVGLASYPDNGLDYAQLFAVADASLYEAKRSGRNRLGAVQKKQITLPIKAFVDRRDEIVTLLHTITNDEKRLRVVVVNGNIGVGKTRFASQGLDLVRGYEVLWADCLLFNEAIAYYAIRELAKYRLQRRGGDIFDGLPGVYRREIGKLVPEILDKVNEDVDPASLVVDRYRLYESVRKSFEIGEQAKAVVIDNFQWVDKESLETLRYVFRALKDLPNIFIFINRVEEVPELVLDFLAEISREVVVDEIELAPLPVSQVRECVRAIIGDEPEDRLVEYTFQSSGGNPFFLEELFRGLAAGGYLTLENDRWQFRAPEVDIIPKSIEQIAQRKYKLLSVEAQAVLRFASIIGRFDLGMLRHLTGYGKGELQGLLTDIQRVGFVREAQGRMVFIDEFSRRAIYRKFVAGVGGAELHRQIAEKLEIDHRGREAEVLDELAMNYYYAKDLVKGMEYCLLAGQRAQEKYANDDAIRYYSWADELLEEEENADARRYDVLLAREKVFDIQGARDAQKKDLNALKNLADVLDDDRRRAAVSLRRAIYSNVIGDYPTAIRAVEEAVRLAQAVQDIGIEAASFLTWGIIFSDMADYSASRVKLEQALPLTHSAGLSAAEARCLHKLGSVSTFQGDVIKSREYHERALRLSRETGDRIREWWALNGLGISFCECGMYAEARLYLEQGLEACREIGDRLGETVVLDSLGHLLYWLGDYVAATECLQKALHIAREIGGRYGQGYHLTNLGHTLAKLGRLDEAADAYGQALALRRELGQHNLAMESIAGLAQVALLQGDLNLAQAQVNLVLKHLESSSLEGTEEPFQVYLTCYQVLQANQDSRAEAILDHAYGLLQGQAAKIIDEVTRHSFMENVTTHRGIVCLYAERHGT